MAGRYLNNNGKKPRKGLKVVLIILGVIVGLVAIALLGGYLYLRSMLDLVNTPEETLPPTAPTTIATDPADPSEESVPETTEQTWPQIVSDQNVTTIMLVGVDSRYGEENNLSDTMIMCTINRETKTLTMTSILRDVYVPLPAYAGHGAGRNRINVCYNLGTNWTGSAKGGMEMLALCVEQNFGIHIDHTVQVGFDSFETIVDMMGGVEIDLTEAEAKFLTEEIGYVGDMEPGLQTLTGIEALGYARIRKIDSDFARTDRQRKVINSLLSKCKSMNLWDLHKLATGMMPLITTDMTTDQMINYIWEFLPMLADLQIVSQQIPLEKSELQTVVPGAWSWSGHEVEGIGNVLEPNIAAHRTYLQQKLGYSDEE